MNCYQFLQIILLTLINGERSIKANAMLGTRLDSMFITTGITKQLCLNGIDQEISPAKKAFQSKLVNLDIFSNLNFEKFKTKKCMGCQPYETTTLDKETVLEKVKHLYSHLIDIRF